MLAPMPDNALSGQMSAADTVMWKIERDPILRSTVTALAVLDRLPDYARLRRRLVSASADFPRLRQVVIPPLGPGGRPRWAEDRNFDIDFHLRRVALPQGGGLEAALELARVSAMAGMDRQRPLWEFTVVEGLTGGQAVFIQKFHHCVTDGVGGIELALRLLDPTRSTRVKGPPAKGATSMPAAQTPGRSGSATTLARGTRLAGDALSALIRPGAAAVALADNARWAGRLLAPVSAPLSPLMRGRSTVWHFDAFEVDLALLKDAAATVGGSVNDVFLTAVAAGLRRYHRIHGHEVDRLRMTLPISIRRPEDPAGGNRFTPVRFTVPVGTGRNPAGTAREMHALVREWREGRAPALTDTLASVLCLLPPGVLATVFGGMLENVDFVATNVQGLPQNMYLAGAEMLRQYAFAPLSGAAVNVALLSHSGWGCIGVNSDGAAVPDPDLLGRCLRAGLAEVVEIAAPSRPGTGRGAA